MTRLLTHSLNGALFLLLNLYHSALVAAPEIQLCLDAHCKNTVKVEISAQTWGEVKQIFATPFPTDKDELDNIIVAFQLLRLDIYHNMQNHNSHDQDAQALYEQHDADTHYKNARQLLELLLDHHLITRHYLRKTIKQRKWYSFGKNISNGLLLQSVNNAKQSVFKINRELLALSPVINPASR